MFTIAFVIFLILIFSVLPGLYFWWPTRRDPTCRSDLGVALMTGAVIAVAVLGIQLFVDHKVRVRDEDRQRADARQNFELTLSLQKDLTGIRLEGEDLRGLHFYGKILSRANLTGANMTDVVLSDAKLELASMERTLLGKAEMSGASMTQTALNEADLTGAILSHAQMRSAQLQRAFLNGADLSNAQLLYANLTEAHLEGASFSNASLVGAVLSGATWDPSTNFEGAIYNAQTRWPDGVKQRRCRQTTCFATNPA